MEVSLLSVLFFSLLLGAKHAVEPDHIIAVSTLASRSNTMKTSSLAGIYWGIGHTMTLLICGFIVIGLKATISETTALTLESLVGVMLIVLGIRAILSTENKVKPSRTGTHYAKAMGIGFVHGLAGSAAMVLLVMSTIDTVWQGSLYMIVFGIGTCAGMLLFTSLIGIPFTFKKSTLQWQTLLSKAAGTVSLLFGIYYLYQLLVVEGLGRLLFI